MCIIAIKPKNKPMFTDSQLRVMFYNNPDGAGLMYYDEELKKVCIEKGFMTFSSLKTYLSAHNFTGTTVVLHFRIGTSGLMNDKNCHPFSVYGTNITHGYCDLGMAHNGVLKNYTPPKGSMYNDTLLFIWSRVRRLEKGFQMHKSTLKRISKEIGAGNKLAFLDNKGKLTLIGNFIKEDGYYYSNASYKSVRKPAHYDVFDWYDYYDMDYDTFQKVYKGGN